MAERSPDKPGSRDEKGQESAQVDRAWDLAAVLRGRRSDILAQWEQEVRKLPNERELPPHQLVDHLPRTLDHLAELAEDVASGKPLRPPEDAAATHAVERYRAGFPLERVVSEYALLRDCIARLCVGTDERVADVLALSQLLDRSVRAAIASYQREQDRVFEELDRISASAASSDLCDLLQRLLRVMLASATVDTAVILLRHDDELRACAAVGLEEEVEIGFSLRIGEGFAGAIAADGRPRLLACAFEDPLVKSEILRAKKVRGLLGVPIVDGDGVVGVVHIGSIRASDFDVQDRRLLSEIAHRAGAAIGQHALRSALERRARQQQAIADLGLHALRAGDLPALMDEAVQVVARTLDLEHASLLELSPDGEAFILRAGVGWEPELVGAPVVSNGIDSLAGATLRANEPMTVDDVQHDPRFTASRFLRERGVASAVTAIVRAPGAGGRPYGVLGGYTRRRRRFHQDDVSFMRAAANVLAAAIVRRRAEEDAQRAIRMRQDVLAVVSHDLRNPLGTIFLGVAQLARAPLAGEAADRVHGVAARLQRSAERMERLIADLLDVASIEAGHLRIEPRDHDLSAVVVEAVETFRPLAAEKSLRMEREGPAGSVIARCDRERLLQALSNLLGNAIKFTPPGGLITLRLDPAADRVRLAVSDTGPGIPEAELPHVFDRYWQGKRRPGQGLGLGLAITKGIVEAHGGALGVESRVGQGTTFFFTLPLRGSGR